MDETDGVAVVKPRIFEWHKTVWDSLIHRQDRLPHATLFHGPTGSGKRNLLKPLQCICCVRHLHQMARHVVYVMDATGSYKGIILILGKYCLLLKWQLTRMLM